MAALALALALPVFAQPGPPPAEPDAAARERLLAWQGSLSPWLSTLVTASGGEKARVRHAVAQARFARAARAPD
ncbi:MAG TPA: hypothetical protein VIM90_04170, partial [Arenimonas sp.]